jgi:hypothetical protein
MRPKALHVRLFSAVCAALVVLGAGCTGRTPSESPAEPDSATAGRISGGHDDTTGTGAAGRGTSETNP